jgi:hypothetical protein
VLAWVTGEAGASILLAPEVGVDAGLVAEVEVGGEAAEHVSVK